MYKIGFSKDIHIIQKKQSESFFLGQCELHENYKIIAKSDGDILLHAVSESILGALGKNDIGYYFDNKSNVKSINILKFALKEMIVKNYKINNIDILIENNEIYLRNYILDIKNNLAKLLKLEVNNISIKCTTNENTTKNVIICYSNVLLIKK